MENLSTFVPSGTPMSENGGDFGSKHDAGPCHVKSTAKAEDWACDEAPHVTPSTATIAQNSFRIRPSQLGRVLGSGMMNGATTRTLFASV
jgi:hypothetical protein